MNAQLRPRIRSLVQLTLPYYFDPKTYIWNRYSTADALMIDIRGKEEDRVSRFNWKKLALKVALEGAPYRPRLYIFPTNRMHNKEKWMGDLQLCNDPRLHGFIIRNNDGDALLEACQVISEIQEGKKKILIPYRIRDPKGESGTQLGDYERIISAGLAKRTADGIRATIGCYPPQCIGKRCSVLVDVEKQAVQHCIIKYYNVGDTARLAQKERLRRAVQRANDMGMAVLATRDRRVTSAKHVRAEMETLKTLGFSGVMLSNPEFICLANEIFD